MRRVAIVTGAGQGIGRAIALRLAGQGWAAVLADINSTTLAETQSAVEQAGGQALSVTVDLSLLADIQRLVNQAADWGTVGVLVNNAGRLVTRPFLDVTEAEWDATLGLDL